MKRTIKFRVWGHDPNTGISQTDNKAMIYLNHWSSYPYDECLVFESQEGYSYCDVRGPNNDVVIMQFTGLQDKNGKDIYEGDIIQCNHNSGIYKMVGEVIYIDHLASYYLRMKDESYSILFGFYNLEVIGNMYENKL